MQTGAGYLTDRRCFLKVWDASKCDAAAEELLASVASLNRLQHLQARTCVGAAQPLTHS